MLRVNRSELVVIQTRPLTANFDKSSKASNIRMKVKQYNTNCFLVEISIYDNYQTIAKEDEYHLSLASCTFKSPVTLSCQSTFVRFYFPVTNTKFNIVQVVNHLRAFNVIKILV